MVQSYQEVLLYKPPVIPEIIEGGILYEGTKLVIFGEPKTFKSLFAQQLAFCLSIGAPWLNFKTTKLKTLYIQAEVPRWMFRKRVVKMGSNITVPPDALYFETNRRMKLDKESGLKDVENNIKRLRPKLLIIDPMYKFTSGPEEQTILRFVDNLDYLIDAYPPLTVVLIHHSRKPRTNLTGSVVDQGGAELRGPIIEQWADSIIRIKGDIMTDDRMLDFELRHAENLIFPIDVHLDRNRLWIDRV